ncbi:serine/threonine protein kinase [Phormidesmis priestleyi ULC007]|uniref:Serine/threonine-protein kinase PknG n=1 Tax=Phormidesmis priestleyi ULC007 TaxID=1920490 RepID=A0A2T1DP29_9CYAN|nr:serine/threonine-protein kinase [Phormidesmis priestleyi]PSB22239.1 serine/threonine protein kinase [Phormidesmis priestleyi ULC007]PZO52500.1 MAG: serine/threonine protein kinase [Phormidesmis priestleyi]
MNGERSPRREPVRCTRNHCAGTLEDGYCNVCGLAAIAASGTRPQPSARVTARSIPVTTGTGSSPLTNRASKGSRRTHSTSARSTRRQLGAGLISIPELPSTDPEKAILIEAKVPENKRFCGNCNNALKREKGFCSQCGQKYSFIATLQPGDVVAGQYEVKGAIAYGGLGWIYLGFDKTLSRYVVLKGLLNSEDAASAAVAVAERQFLAVVKHPNIVGIYNFVNHGTEGFIIMEYVGGQTLKDLRKQRGVLPVTEAIAYIHRILSAFAYLHQLGLVYCDFKPDNVMLEGDDVKLIDLGGVRRIDDPNGDIYGTVGYSAPEAGEGPTIASDLFTVARTLAVLITNIKGFSKEHLFTLPNADEDPIFAQHESLYRFLIKATAENPDDRLQTADEMADQLLGVLREMVALETNVPRPTSSNLFSGDRLALTNSSNSAPINPNHDQLPTLLLNSTDPGFNAVMNASAIADSAQRTENLLQAVKQFPNSTEAPLRLADSLIGVKSAQAETYLAEVEAKDPWDWRVLWYRGRSLMAQGKFKEAQAAFDQVYFDLPGELAPKLALALSAEQAKNYPLAIKMYDLVSRTDPSYVSAAFGLARCLNARGDRQAAVAALERVPPSSSLFTRSRVEVARTLINRDRGAPGTSELRAASVAIEALTLDGVERHRLTQQVLETALHLVTTKAVSPTSTIAILGQPLEEPKIRKGLEKALRDLAHLAIGDEKIRLVDEANRVRPRSIF